MEDIITIVKDNTDLDYFDLRALVHTNKTLNNIIKSYNNNNKQGNELYILIHDYLLLHFPNAKQKPNNINGVKIVFNVDNYYNSLIIGMTSIMNNIYIARANQYEQFDIDEGHLHRNIIESYIKYIEKSIKSIDIYYYNINMSTLNKFLSCILKITMNKDIAINIHNEDFLSNVLLSHH